VRAVGQRLRVFRHHLARIGSIEQHRTQIWGYLDIGGPAVYASRSLRLLDNATITCPQAEIAVNNDNAMR
jgi:hypothetical protein